MERRGDRKGLGRGLSALMSDVSAEAPETPPRPETTVPIDRIAPNPDQPRRAFTEAALEDLAASIRTKGILQPLILRPDPANPDGYQIVAGERRWRAAQRAQVHDVPAIIRTLTDTEVLEVAIVENIQRADLNAIEEATGYRQLMDRFGHTQEQLAAALGKSRSHIANLLRLLALPPDIRGHVETGALSAGHARALITAADPGALAADVVKRGLSVRETEKLAKADGAGSGRATPAKDADTRNLEQELSASLGRNVRIEAKGGGKGRLVLGYDSLEDLETLCRHLSGEPAEA